MLAEARAEETYGVQGFRGGSLSRPGWKRVSGSVEGLGRGLA